MNKIYKVMKAIFNDDYSGNYNINDADDFEVLAICTETKYAYLAIYRLVNEDYQERKTLFIEEGERTDFDECDFNTLWKKNDLII